MHPKELQLYLQTLGFLTVVSKIFLSYNTNALGKLSFELSKPRKLFRPKEMFVIPPAGAEFYESDIFTRKTKSEIMSEKMHKSEISECLVSFKCHVI